MVDIRHRRRHIQYQHHRLPQASSFFCDIRFFREMRDVCVCVTRKVV